MLKLYCILFINISVVTCLVCHKAILFHCSTQYVMILTAAFEIFFSANIIYPFVPFFCCSPWFSSVSV